MLSVVGCCITHQPILFHCVRNFTMKNKILFTKWKKREFHLQSIWMVSRVHQTQCWLAFVSWTWTISISLAKHKHWMTGKENFLSTPLGCYARYYYFALIFISIILLWFVNVNYLWFDLIYATVAFFLFLGKVVKAIFCYFYSPGDFSLIGFRENNFLLNWIDVFFFANYLHLYC